MPQTTLTGWLGQLQQAGYDAQTGGGAGAQASPGYTPAQQGGAYGIGGGAFAIQPAQPEYFNLPQFAAAQGFNPRTPTGQAMPSANRQSWDAFAQKMYGMSPQEFLLARPEERYAGWATQAGRAPTYEAYTQGFEGGVPGAPPGTPQEAGWAQFASEKERMKRQEEDMANQMAVLQWLYGGVQQGGPGSIAAAMQPAGMAMAGAYGSRERMPADYSYWSVPQTPTPGPADASQMMISQVPQTIGGGAAQPGYSASAQRWPSIFG